MLLPADPPFAHGTRSFGGLKPVQFNIETKIEPGDERTVAAEEFVEAVVEAVRHHGMLERTTIPLPSASMSDART